MTMDRRKLDHLRRLLVEPGPHLDDESLAAIATAEAAGEDVAARFAAELAHVESCVACADSYAALVELMQAAIADMAEVATAPTPEEAFIASLSAAAGPAVPRPYVAGLVASLPLLLVEPPADAAAAEQAVAHILSQADSPANATIVAALARAMRATWPALVGYLRRQVDAVWGEAVTVVRSAAGPWHALELRLKPAEQPLLGVKEPGPEWSLFSQRVGEPLSLRIDAQATRSGPLACRLSVRADRPGLANPAGRRVELLWPGHQSQALTDETGIATFDAVPIAALPQATIRIADRPEGYSTG
jgi:hypothetical protein